ncbi:MAG TPA: alpha/beta hydrolase [Candidatus Limnocylindrales bacterium]
MILSLGGKVRRSRPALFGIATATAIGALAALAGCTAGSEPGTGSGGTASPALPAPTAPTATEATTLYEVAYADISPKHRLDLYLPKPAASPAPLLVWVHGGGFRVGDKVSVTSRYDPSAPPPRQPSECREVVQVQAPDVAALNAKGYAVAAVNYRLEANPVMALQDVKAAVRFLRANAARYHLDADRFAAWGDSAGGYLVVMLGVTSGQKTKFDDPKLGNPDVPSTVQAVVDWFGPTDANNMPGDLGQEDSPYTYIAAGRPIPPFMIAHGDNDCVVPVDASRRLADALTKAGLTATLTVVPGGIHEDPAFMRTLMTPTFAFLDKTFGR